VIGVYTHARPDGRVFYVGKGGKKRAHNLRPRNQYHANIVKKCGPESIIIGWVGCESEEQAFGLERHLIAACKEIGIKLTNMTDGGEGTSGFIPNAETRAKLSASRIGNKHFLGHKHTSESRAKISTSLKGHGVSSKTMELMCGANNPLKNEKIKRKVSQSLKGHCVSLETRAKISKANKGIKRSEKIKTQHSNSMKNRVWINNSQTSRMVKPENIPEGWKRGKL
jgi:hypothetical protein